MELVAETMAHPPEDAMVFVTVYEPDVLVNTFTCPVLVLTNTNPAVEEKVPATPDPLKVGLGLLALVQ